MPFEPIEESRTLGEPVELYFFVYGSSDTEYYAYTDSEEPITIDVGAPYGSVEFQPHPIMRDTVKSSGTLDKQSLTVSLQRDAEVAELFRVYPPTQPVTAIIRQGHFGDTEFLVIWTGRVLSCKFTDSEAELTCEPVATSMKRAGLRRNYQYGCPHALYMGNDQAGCHADKAAATVSATVTAISGSTLSLSSGWNGSFAAEKFINGMVEWTTAAGSIERRTTLNLSGNDLSLSGIIRNLTVGATVSVILGCNHQLDDCADLHNVIGDYGGQWLIPTKSPFGFYNNYY
jgi:hypothetical protein